MRRDRTLARSWPQSLPHRDLPCDAQARTHSGALSIGLPEPRVPPERPAECAASQRRSRPVRRPPSPPQDSKPPRATSRTPHCTAGTGTRGSPRRPHDSPGRTPGGGLRRGASAKTRRNTRQRPPGAMRSHPAPRRTRKLRRLQVELGHPSAERIGCFAEEAWREQAPRSWPPGCDRHRPVQHPGGRSPKGAPASRRNGCCATIASPGCGQARDEGAVPLVCPYSSFLAAADRSDRQSTARWRCSI
jgi:hypothetical protein